MARTIPSIEPTSFTVGETVKWYRTFPDFPVADGWVLSYTFNGPAKLDLTSEVTDDDNQFVIVVPNETTANLVPGVYKWTAYVALDGERYVAGSGTTLIQVDLANVTSAESFASKALRIIEDKLAGRFNADTESFSLNGRSVNLTPIRELEKLRDKYRWEVWQERNPGRIGVPVKVQF